MCKFHKNVARDISTDPVTGEFDPGRYSVALVAMAKFRIEQYMPLMHGCDGFVPALMVTDTAKAAFAASGIDKKSAAEIQNYRDAYIGMIRDAMTQTASRHDLSMQGLGIPDKITREGYKHCDKMPADPTKNGPFLDEAVVDLFEGYDRPGYVSGELRLKAEAHKPSFAAIHAAAADFMAQENVVPVLKHMFENSLSKVFQEAQADYDAGRGFQKTDGCVMCEDRTNAVPKRDLPQVPAKKVNPQAPAQSSAKNKLAKFSVTCGSCAGAAGGTVLGVLASHLPCIAIPVIAAVMGVAIGGAFMTGAMLVAAPAVAVVTTVGIDKWRKKKVSKKKAAISAALAFSVALGISGFSQSRGMQNMPMCPQHGHMMQMRAPGP